MSNLWLTADSHWGHEHVRIACQRPFSNTDEMDDALIERWNAVVAPGDRVYHLGDVSFHRDPKHTRKLLHALKGQKYLIKGNHDERNGLSYWADAFVWAKDLATIRMKEPGMPDGYQHLVLSHYAQVTWHRMGYGSIMAHGHSHGGLKTRPSLEQIDLMESQLKKAFRKTAACTEILGHLRRFHQARRVDVGVDCWDYAPVSYEQLKALMATRAGCPVDHHGGEVEG